MIDLAQDNIDTMFNFITGLIGDLMPLILIILGIILAFFVLEGLIIKKTENDDIKN